MIKKREFLEKLEKEVLLCDGAMGTFLYTHGVPLNERDEQNLTNPDLIKWVHQQYIDAGAQIIQTNTFTSNRLKLRELGLEDRLLDINQAAVQAALEVAGDQVFVAGSVGPLGALVRPYGNLTIEDLGQVYKEQIHVLAESGVHLILIETHPSLLEALEAVRAAKATCDLPIVAQMTFWEDGKSKFGDDIRRSLEALAAADADVVGVNCTLGPQEMFDLVNEFVAQSDLKISVQPNAGHPQIINGKTVFLSSPEYLEEYARAFLNCGVNIIGGCCGTTPEHIRAMARVVSGQVPKPHRRRAVAVRVEVESLEEEAAAPAFGEGLKTPRLLDKVGTKILATCEINPPKGLEYGKMVEGARLLKEAGVDAVNITDNPMARVRMSSVAMAHILQREVGIEAIWQLTCRDRNVIGIQSDLLGAAALGIRAVLALTGDPITIGDYPKGTAVFEVNSTGLVKIVKGLNNGFDLAEQNIGTKTEYQIGTAASPAASDLDREIARLEEKLEAGADFVQTQPVFDVALAEKFMRRVERLKVPVLLGIMPLRSSRHAEFMHNEVPGISIPEWIRERMKKPPEGAAAEEGMEIAAQLIEQIKGMSAGLHFYPPVNRFDMVVRLVETLNPKSTRA